MLTCTSFPLEYTPYGTEDILKKNLVLTTDPLSQEVYLGHSDCSLTVCPQFEQNLTVKRPIPVNLVPNALLLCQTLEAKLFINQDGFLTRKVGTDGREVRMHPTRVHFPERNLINKGKFVGFATQDEKGNKRTIFIVNPFKDTKIVTIKAYGHLACHQNTVVVSTEELIRVFTIAIDTQGEVAVRLELSIPMLKERMCAFNTSGTVLAYLERPETQEHTMTVGFLNIVRGEGETASEGGESKGGLTLGPCESVRFPLGHRDTPLAGMGAILPYERMRFFFITESLFVALLTRTDIFLGDATSKACKIIRFSALYHILDIIQTGDCQCKAAVLDLKRGKIRLHVIDAVSGLEVAERAANQFARQYATALTNGGFEPST